MLSLAAGEGKHACIRFLIKRKANTAEVSQKICGGLCDRINVTILLRKERTDMLITKLRTNHLENPLGFSTDLLTLSWVAEAAVGKQTGARVEIASDSDFAHILLDTGMSADISGIAYTPDLALAPRTRYYWRVTVAADDG